MKTKDQIITTRDVGGGLAVPGGSFGDEGRASPTPTPQNSREQSENVYENKGPLT